MRFWGYNQVQTLKQKQKIDEKQIQLQDQNNSNRLLMLLLSTAENLASKLNNNLRREYFSHDFGHSFESKSINKILLQFIEQIEIFESSYKRYCKEYNEYDFPFDYKLRKGLSKEEIINDLIKWMNLVEEKYQKYYLAVIGILENKPIPDFTSDIENIPDINDLGREDKCNPKILREVYPVLLEQVNAEKRQIAKEYSNNKNYKIIINKRENNNNQKYEKIINERIAKNKMNSLYPEKTKIEIKYESLQNLNKSINLPQFVVDKLKLFYHIDAGYYELLRSWLHNYPNNTLFQTLDEFFKLMKLDNVKSDKLIDHIINEIYKEITFDNH